MADDRAAVIGPGELVTANIMQGGGHIKYRPVLLVKPAGPTGWYAMGLTTQPCYGDGMPRRPVPDWKAVGLNSRGFLWAATLARVPTADIHSHIGWTDEALARAVVELAGLATSTLASLLERSR